MLLRTVYLSLDPYMRGRMNDVKSYVPPVGIGQTMEGGAVSVVEESRHPEFAAGDIVFGYTGWQQYSIAGGKGMRTVDPSIAPISTALGILGMPGLTGYVGLLDLGRPKEGETVVVSAATGAVGSLVGQIAKLKGCRVVGVAGAEAKCRYAVDALGLDACVSHRGRQPLRRPEGGLPGRRRRLLRERRRQGLRRGHRPDERARPHPRVRQHRPLQRHRTAARAGPFSRARCASFSPAG